MADEYFSVSGGRLPPQKSGCSFPSGRYTRPSSLSTAGVDHMFGVLRVYVWPCGGSLVMAGLPRSQAQTSSPVSAL